MKPEGNTLTTEMLHDVCSKLDFGNTDREIIISQELALKLIDKGWLRFEL